MGISGNLFEIEWFEESCGPEVERPEEKYTLARVKIGRDDIFLTLNKNFEINDETLAPSWVLSDSAVMSLHDVAHWFAWYYYRICYEQPVVAPKNVATDADSDLDNVVAHCMAYADGSSSLPPIVIQAEGETVSLTLDPLAFDLTDGTEFQIYQEKRGIELPLDEFEGELLTFLDEVDSRLKNFGIKTSVFQLVYDELKAELTDPEMLTYRKTEAMSGCDPDESLANPTEPI